MPLRPRAVECLGTQTISSVHSSHVSVTSERSEPLQKAKSEPAEYSGFARASDREVLGHEFTVFKATELATFSTVLGVRMLK